MLTVPSIVLHNLRQQSDNLEDKGAIEVDLAEEQLKVEDHRLVPHKSSVMEVQK